MSDIKEEIERFRDGIERSTGVEAQLYWLNKTLLLFIEYLVEIEEEGRGDSEL